MVKIITTLIASFLFTATGFAQAVNTHPSYISIMRTTTPLYGQQQTLTMCGGVVVDEKRKLIATALHCIPNDKMALVTLSVHGKPIQLRSISLEADMAILEVVELRGAKVPAFATPKVGETISASAFFDNYKVGVQGPSDHAFSPITIREVLSWETKVIAVARGEKWGPPFFDKPTKTDFEWVVVASNPTFGFSGGPMFDKNGKFVGIVSNGNGGFTNVSSSQNVLILLKQIK